MLPVLGTLLYSLPMGCWRWDEANAEELQARVFLPRSMCGFAAIMRLWLIRLEEPLKGLQRDVKMGFWVCVPSC